MSLSPEMLQYLETLARAIIGKAEHRLIRRIVTSFTNSDEEVPSSKLVKNEFTAVRSEIPTNTSDLTNDGADGTHAFIVEGDSRLNDTRDPKPHNQASSTITDTNTYSNIGNTLQDQASINSAINEKIGALMNLDIIEQVSTRPTASADTLNKIYAVPENDPTSENLFQYFITIYEDNAYKWDKIDIAQVDISGKVDKVEGKQLSTEDFTTEEKTKLSYIEPEANKTIVDSTFIIDSTNPVQSNVIQALLNRKANTSDLAAVATTGDYDDLINKPNIVEGSTSTEDYLYIDTVDAEITYDDDTTDTIPILADIRNVDGIKKIAIIWKDSNNANNTRPSSVTARLMRDGTQINSYTLSEDDNWQKKVTVSADDGQGNSYSYTWLIDGISSYALQTDYDGGLCIVTITYIKSAPPTPGSGDDAPELDGPDVPDAPDRP